MSQKCFSVFLLLVVVTISIINALPTKKSNYIEQEKSCRDVCGLCDCDGFYCEDECICECNLESDDNIQCIADMKQECDAHGLEYEILMQEAAKARFLRQVKPEGFDFNDFSKHLVILKQKRASNSTDPIVGAPAPAAASSGTANAAAQPAKPADPTVGMSASSARITGTASAFNFGNLDVNKVLMDLRNYKFPTVPRAQHQQPSISELLKSAADSLPTMAPLPTLPTLPTMAPLQPVKLSLPALPQHLTRH